MRCVLIVLCSTEKQFSLMGMRNYIGIYLYLVYYAICAYLLFYFSYNVSLNLFPLLAVSILFIDIPIYCTYLH